MYNDIINDDISTFKGCAETAIRVARFSIHFVDCQGNADAAVLALVVDIVNNVTFLWNLFEIFYFVCLIFNFVLYLCFVFVKIGN